MALNVMSCKTPITVQIEPLRKLWCLFGLFDFPNGSPSCAFEPLQPRTSLLDARIPVRLCLVQCLKSIARLSFRRVTWEPAIPLRFKWRGLCSARTKNNNRIDGNKQFFLRFWQVAWTSLFEVDLTAANTFADQDFASSIHRDQVLVRTL